MSVQAIGAALGLSGVTSGEKFLLVILANYADEDFVCWPSQKRLAGDGAMTDRSVRNLLTSLEKKGLIFRTARDRANGSATSKLVALQIGKYANRKYFPHGFWARHPEMNSGPNRKITTPKAEMVSAPEHLEPSIRKERGCARDLEGRAPARREEKIQGETGKVLFNELTEALAAKRRKMT